MGSDSESSYRSSPSPSNFYYRREEEIDPEELFRMFFGEQYGLGKEEISGGFNYSDTQTFRTRRRRQDQDQGIFSIQLFPVLLMLFLSFVSNLFSSSAPEYAFEYTQATPVSRKTFRLDVPYFVTLDYSKQIDSNWASRSFRSDVYRFEEEVERSYLGRLQRMCALEQQSQRPLKSCNEIDQLLSKRKNKE